MDMNKRPLPPGLKRGSIIFPVTFELRSDEVGLSQQEIFTKREKEYIQTHLQQYFIDTYEVEDKDSERVKVFGHECEVEDMDIS